ncbi:hypothetical protein PC116_g24878 [Phytophthora cactorum]|uniref:Uncharacterized protein n=1 Tax=Phytophthora cactorum TaxID=29920 RepID=A0A329RI89_9STRA|nr:hypothetical protein PC114_g1121 [Phytophthora cactorum]KAG4226718.1 hypothetical protein PC116_g24878 [Phytophthora cactorum]RAW23859.1 hypothetical protein PC110_g19712 [Phytophthora cactorum]
MRNELDERQFDTRRIGSSALSFSETYRTSCSRNAIELSESERIVYNRMKEMLSASVTLAFSKEEATTCLLIDASDSG